jgi:predicted metal-dependent peptidase
MRRSKEIAELSEEELRELQKDIERGAILQRDIEKARGEGYLGISNILDLILRKKNRNWRKILRETFSEIRTVAKDYDYTRASKKVWILKKEYGISTFIPNIRKESNEVNVIIGIDVSGSISDKEYREFVNEVYTLASDVKVRGWIVMWEARVTKVIEMKNGWNKRILDVLRERVGYGGTIIKSFFDKASELAKNKKKNTYLIILTDGETEDVEKEWVKGWKKVVFITQSKEALKNVESERNVEIAYYEA